MNDFVKFCNKLSQFDNPTIDEISNRLKFKTFAKNDFILRSGKVCKYLYFINYGLAKTFFYKEDKEFIMRFFPEYSMFTVLDSFISETPSTYNILALEHTKLAYISKIDIEKLCENRPCFEIFYRKLISLASINMMKRISEMLEENATQKYHHFVQENNQLMQRINLGDLANYIGVSQVTLSRIRAKK
ncbi:Crp/Fnr family transcriptional regulator [Pedobacter sp. UYP30]|uniref:Crp/Fnr family transcriptional regulator n=1 Tax=Pedobacter sp. UYP30 TaxID=1756400 RepID=UPI003397CFDD